VTQGHDRALPFVEGEQAPFDGPTRVFSVKVVEGAWLVARWNVLEVFGLHPDFMGSPPLFLTVAVDGGVDGDAGEPGAHLGPGINPLRLLKEFDEGILNHLEGVLGVSQIAVGDTVETPFVPGHERRQRLFLPRREAGKEMRIVVAFARGHKERSSATSAQIDKDPFAIIFGDLHQRAERELVQVGAAELPEFAPRFRAAASGAVAEILIV